MDNLPVQRGFSVVVSGQSAHGATPHMGHDAIVTASAIIVQLQTVVSRMQDPLSPLKLSVRSVSAGKEYNIICDRAELSGELSAPDEASLARTAGNMEHLAARTAESMGCSAMLTFSGTKEEQP